MRVGILATFLVLTGSAWAIPAFDLARLMQLLAETPSSQATYVEKRFSALLSEPVVSSGTLAYRRPDIVEKNMSKPHEEQIRIEGGNLAFTRNGKTRRIALSSEPTLAAFAASLRGVLSGNAALLSEHYRLVLTGTEQDWKLEMTPIEDEITRYVTRIIASGSAGHVAQIEVQEASGDRSVMTVN